jgi:hypothetical protein
MQIPEARKRGSRMFPEAQEAKALASLTAVKIAG